jgi:hypothetical protein
MCGTRARASASIRGKKRKKKQKKEGSQNGCACHECKYQNKKGRNKFAQQNSLGAASDAFKHDEDGIRDCKVSLMCRKIW